MRDVKPLFIVFSTAISGPHQIPAGDPVSELPMVIPSEGIAVRMEFYEYNNVSKGFLLRKTKPALSFITATQILKS